MRDFLNEPYIPQWNPGTKYLRVLILGLLGHAAFYEDETHYGIFPYADQRENLSFIVCVKVKWVLCYFVIVSRPVAYVEYSKPKKHNVRRKAFTTAYFGLHSCFAWVSDFQLQSNIVMAMGHQLLTSTTSKPANKNIIETTTPPWVVYIIVTLPLNLFKLLTSNFDSPDITSWKWDCTIVLKCM